MNRSAEADPTRTVHRLEIRNTYMPERLKLRDVRAIFRLVGELRELGADPNAWRPHMVKRLLDIVQAQVVVSSEVHFKNNPGKGTMQVVDVGWACNEDGKTWQIQVERDDEKPENYWLDAGGKDDAEGT